MVHTYTMTDMVISISGSDSGAIPDSDLVTIFNKSEKPPAAARRFASTDYGAERRLTRKQRRNETKLNRKSHAGTTR
jgi:hypothetical protein